MLPVHSYDMAKQEAQAKLHLAEKARRAAGPATHRNPRSLLKSVQALLARI